LLSAAYELVGGSGITQEMLRITNEVAGQEGSGITEQNERTLAMKTSNQYLRFCGIDMGKQKHVVCIIDYAGRYILKPISFRNNADGFGKILNCLKQTGRPNRLYVNARLTSTMPST